MKGDMRRNQKELGIPAFGCSCFKGCSIIDKCDISLCYFGFGCLYLRRLQDSD